jgi:hypothetical protein
VFTIGVGILGFSQQRPTWSVLFVAIAVLFNPIVPIYLKRAEWFYIDLGVAAVFLAHFVFVRQKFK